MCKMRNMGLDENLVRWTSNFISERRVKIVVDGQEGDEVDVTTGLPQGSAVSPILFAIYIAEFVESRVPGVRALSFVAGWQWDVRTMCEMERTVGQRQRGRVRNIEDRDDPLLPKTETLEEEGRITNTSGGAHHPVQQRGNSVAGYLAGLLTQTTVAAAGVMREEEEEPGG